MQELIELRTFCEQEKEKANERYKYYSKFVRHDLEKGKFKGRKFAFSSVIERLDLILNNSVVKPSERRSPTDETFSGCNGCAMRSVLLAEIIN